MLSRLFESISVPPEFLDWGLQVMGEYQEEVRSTREAVAAQQAQQIGDLESRVDKLLELKMRDLLTDEEYLDQKEKMRRQIMSLRMEQQAYHEGTDEEWANMERIMVFTAYGKLIFEGGKPEMQSIVARAIGTQFVMTDRSLAVELHPALTPFCELKKSLDIGSLSPEVGDSTSLCQLWWGIVDETRTALAAYPREFPALVPLSVT